MMGAIKTKTLNNVIVQENGIIRDETGLLIATLDNDVKFDDIENSLKIAENKVLKNKMENGMTAKEVFKQIWIEEFGEEKEANEQLDIALEHDYMFRAMERYANQKINILNPKNSICAYSKCNKYSMSRGFCEEHLKLQPHGI